MEIGKWLKHLFTWPVGHYLLLIFLFQLLLYSARGLWKWVVSRRRRRAGLPATILMDPAARLYRLRWEALLQAGLLLLAVFGIPFWLILHNRDKMEPLTEDPQLLVFAAILVWLVWQGTDVAKAFLGGLAFKTLVAVQHPLQVGDRVTLKGQSGKVNHIGIFFVTLKTLDDDQVSIPTRELWSDVLLSTNAGARASMCVMPFYLAPGVTQAQRQLAEDTIWDAMQASAYCDTAQPMQIYLSQRPESICLTAKAYVTSTYDEPLFKSDVTRAFLDVASAKKIPIGVSA